MGSNLYEPPRFLPLRSMSGAPTCATTTVAPLPPLLTRLSMALPSWEALAPPTSARMAHSDGPGSAWHVAELLLAPVQYCGTAAGRLGDANMMHRRAW